MLSALLLAAGLGSAPPCPALSGAEALFTRPGLETVIVQEIVGTEQAPIAFADLVCIAARAGRPVLVLLDYPAAEQAETQAYLASDGSETAQQRFLAQRRWSQLDQDGRAGIGVLRLIERLRRLVTEGKAITVRPLERAADPAGPTSVRLALVSGDVADGPTADPAYGRSPVRLRIEATGGQAWNCSGGCSYHPLPAMTPRPRGLYLTADATGAGVLALGGQATAALPAARYIERKRMEKAGVWTLFDDLFP